MEIYVYCGVIRLTLFQIVYQYHWHYTWSFVTLFLLNLVLSKLLSRLLHKSPHRCIYKFKWTLSANLLLAREIDKLLLRTLENIPRNVCFHNFPASFVYWIMPELSLLKVAPTFDTSRLLWWNCLHQIAGPCNVNL